MTMLRVSQLNLPYSYFVCGRIDLMMAHSLCIEITATVRYGGQFTQNIKQSLYLLTLEDEL